MSRRIAIAGWIGSDNLGDELILRSLADTVRERGATPVAISLDPGTTEAVHGIESVAHRGPRDTRTLDRALTGVDGLIFGGGGLVQDETSPWNVPFHFSRIQRALRQDLPVLGLALGVGRVEGRVARRLVERVLPRLEAVVVRDSDSAARLADLDVHGARVGTDPVVGVVPRSADASATIAVMLRRPNRPGVVPARWRPAPDEQDPFLTGIQPALDSLAEATGATLRLVAMQPGRDGPLHEVIAEGLHGPVELVSPRLETVMDTVADCQAVVTMRYHGGIAALLHSKPTVLLDYSPKMGGLADEGGGWAPTVGLGGLDGDSLLEGLRAARALVARIPAALEGLRSRLSVNHGALDDFLATL